MIFCWLNIDLFLIFWYYSLSCEISKVQGFERRSPLRLSNPRIAGSSSPSAIRLTDTPPGDSHDRSFFPPHPPRPHGGLRQQLVHRDQEHRRSPVQRAEGCHAHQLRQRRSAPVVIRPDRRRWELDALRLRRLPGPRGPGARSQDRGRRRQPGGLHGGWLAPHRDGGAVGHHQQVGDQAHRPRPHRAVPGLLVRCLRRGPRAAEAARRPRHQRSRRRADRDRRQGGRRELDPVGRNCAHCSSPRQYARNARPIEREGGRCSFQKTFLQQNRKH